MNADTMDPEDFHLFFDMLGLWSTVGLILLGLIAGRFAERAHLKKLDRREASVRDVLVTNLRPISCGVYGTAQATIVMGQTVIATDYFKSFLAKLRKIFGGELGTYRSLMVRARREAVVQLLEQAKSMGCDVVCNIRLDPSDLGGAGVKRKGMTIVAIMATGTAYRRESP